MKIDRALIIRREQVKLSMEYAEGCAESCKKHNLPYEFITAVEFLSCDEAFKSVGAKKLDGYHNTQGNCCCHASHIKAWKRIIEIGKPCIILEHDAVVKGDVRNIDIPDLAVVTFGNRVAHENQYEPIAPIQSLIPIKRSVGVHACGLTPKTAEHLLYRAVNEGVSVGIDRWLMMERRSALPLFIADPPQVVCWARTSTSNFTLKGKQVERPARSASQINNFKESLTENWKKGMKKR